jgi:hypothetical protein
MDDLKRLIIEAECTRLMHSFNWAVDAMDYDQVESLFDSECIFSRADKYFYGYSGLRESLNGRPKDRTTRHLSSNIVIDIVDDDNATGKACCVVYGYRGAIAPGAEAHLGVPDSLILHETKFVRRDGKWRIAHLHIGLSFRKPAP